MKKRKSRQQKSRLFVTWPPDKLHKSVCRARHSPAEHNKEEGEKRVDIRREKGEERRGENTVKEHK